MAQLGGAGRSDISDRPERELGQVRISGSYQDEYLPLILNELRRLSVMLAEIAGLDIDLNEEVS